MLAFSALTPYYNEEVIYSKQQLKEENEDGVTILFYLQRIFPGINCIRLLCLHLSSSFCRTSSCIIYKFLVIYICLSTLYASPSTPIDIENINFQCHSIENVLELRFKTSFIYCRTRRGLVELPGTYEKARFSRR